MESRRLSRLGVIAGGTAIVAMGLFTAGCSSTSKESPTTTTTTTTTTTSVAPAPTEKQLDPNGGNLFTPGVKAPAAPTVAPGQHPGINGVN
jgi:hypothetical protein